MEKPDILTIDNRLLSDLHLKALSNVRKRQHFDLRTTHEDKSQRMLNVLEVDTKVPIHQHTDTSESIICLEGKIDCVVYEESSGYFKEIARYCICPREKLYGIQIPSMVWHSVEVYEPSTIFESKDGAYMGG